MAIGKREQVVGLSLGVLGAIFVIHMFIFKPKADQFAELEAEYKGGMELLKGAERIPPGSNLLEKENAKTQDYKDKLSSVTAQLNIQVPDYFKEGKPENFQKRLDEMLAAVRELVRLRDAGQAPKMTFLGDRRFPQNPYLQLGWNLPSRLPIFDQIKDRNQARARLWDLVKLLDDNWNITNGISNPEQRMRYRVRYNEILTQLGLNPVELSNFYYQSQNGQMVFFNDKKTYEELGGQAKINSEYSINRYGVFLPDIYRMWMLELIWAEKDQNTQISRDKLHQVLEIGLPFDDRMLYINKQLTALADIIKMAGKAGVQEITEVRMMKPADFVKVEHREPGKGPVAAAAAPGAAGAAATPAATPDPNAPAQKVAKGAGLEVYFLGSNPSTIDFLFQVTTMPRTYALDDLYIHAMQGNTLFTSTTVELVMKLDSANAAAPTPAN